MHITPRSDQTYRCHLARTHAVAETGERPFVQLRAPSAVIAAHLALAVTGAVAVVEVERIEVAS
ncbi:MAG: hypothetical protein RJA99_4271 [Pseudomonadota bacterium]|jgi:hypothetical protein